MGPKGAQHGSTWHGSKMVATSPNIAQEERGSPPHAHTRDWFWELKLVPKWVLLEVRVEVAKVPNQQNSKLCEGKRGAAVNRNRNQQFKLVWRRYAQVINPCFLGCLQRASLGKALQAPSAPLQVWKMWRLNQKPGPVQEGCAHTRPAKGANLSTTRASLV